MRTVFFNHIDPLLEKISGHNQDYSLEKRLILLLLVGCILVLIVGIFTVLALAARHLYLSHLVFLSISISLYIKIRFFEFRDSLLWIPLVLLYCSLLHLYFIESGIKGPTILAVLTLHFFNSFIRTKMSYFTLFFFCLVTICCMVLEHYSSDIVVNYLSRKEIFIDTIIAYFTFTILPFLAVILYFKNYDFEKNLVEKQKLQIEQLLEREKRMTASKVSFFTNISHEFRTPISLILAPLESLKNYSVVGEHAEKYQIIYRNAKKLSDLVDQVLDFQNLEDFDLKLHPKESNLVEFFYGLGNSFKTIAEVKNISYNIICRYPSLYAVVDTNIIQKILSNLLSNAFKYTQVGGEVSLTMQVNQYKSTLCYIVKDNGKGIPKKYHSDVLKPFFQVDSAIYGTGIGLSIVKECIEIYKGKIYLDSHPGKGTEIQVELPVELELSKTKNSKKDEVTFKIDPLSDESKIGKTGSAAMSKNRYKLLIVEDNADIREYLRSELRKDFIIRETANGIDGFDKVLETRPDIILSDIMMPGLDGFNLCKKIKENSTTAHIPVILLTAKSLERDKIHGLTYGADDYIIKPFSTEELRVRLMNAIIRRKVLMKRYLEDYRFDESYTTFFTNCDEEFLMRVNKKIEENMSSIEFGTHSLVESLHMSRTHVYTKIKKLTGLSTSQYINNLRIKKAAYLLKNSGMNISEVCIQVGYKDLSYFSRCFKKVFLLSPKNYCNKIAD